MSNTVTVEVHMPTAILIAADLLEAIREHVPDVPTPSIGQRNLSWSTVTITFIGGHLECDQYDAAGTAVNIAIWDTDAPVPDNVIALLRTL